MRVVAIDGPSGSGKSTVARTLAAQLGLEYLDTGAMYRAVAFAALQRNIDPADADTVAKLVQDLHLVTDGPNVTVDGVDASVEIRGSEVTRAVSAVAANPDVRRELVSRQREWIRTRSGGVVEGRDIGTEVWPDADLKVYLTADLSVRAARRQQEIGASNQHDVAADLARRDAKDSTREASPLTQAADAVLIDTTGRTVEDIVADLLGRLP
ncbi:MAG: cmk [Acidimicrobiales bacterium]|nr:cmk [Acidimicrobiales bacterium]